MRYDLAKRRYSVETKSLRQLANELGVSVSYLSQVRNGKRPPSLKVYQALCKDRT
jgi:transcriptional regulator with XRE-family HTH domain